MIRLKSISGLDVNLEFGDFEKGDLENRMIASPIVMPIPTRFKKLIKNINS